MSGQNGVAHSRRSLLILLSISLFSLAESTFTLVDEGCVSGSGSNCAKRWHFYDGPGYTGQRTEWQTQEKWKMKLYCSPSCTKKDNPKVCSHIVAMHGIYSNPSDQRWLQMGTDDVAENYIEDEANGGPFCVSFHKAEDFPWDYSCNGNDADHIHGFIEYMLENFPIDPDAVNLTGFSSGAIQTNNFMMASCKVEKYISAAAPYGGGWVNSPPTSTAEFLIGHGTHDNVVPYLIYEENGNNIATCQCDGLPGSTSNCFAGGKKNLYGPSLAAGIALLRGYTGDPFSQSTPPPTEQINLIDPRDEGKCNEVVNTCYNPFVSPNPWNDNYPCPNTNTDETDVIHYPNDLGPIVLLKMNYHNHDYPNRRRVDWGPTEFFLYMRKFFNDNRGRNPRHGQRSMEEQATNIHCVNPRTYDTNSIYVRSHWEATITPEICSDMCRDDKLCIESFHMDLPGYDNSCYIYLEACISYENTFGWATTRHFKASTEYNPTTAPIGEPTKSPSPTAKRTDSPTSPPTPFSEPSLCLPNYELIPSNVAGYSCLGTGEDSNWGATEQDCLTDGGTWTAYDCATAELYYLNNVSEGHEEYEEKWRPQCCRPTFDTQPPTPAPPTQEFCLPDFRFLPENDAGYSCDATGEDSNFSDVTEESCNADGGNWIYYNCGAAADYYESANPDYLDFLAEAWRPKCCVEFSPTQSPTSEPTENLPPTFQDCPRDCMVPICHWSGKDGPGWDPSWSADDDDLPTKNGVCTGYCSPEYDVDLGRRLCGNSPWHISGIDCRGCASIANDPTLPSDDQQESSGLCADISLSEHALWGKGIKQCDNGPLPTNSERCTVWQTMNGDAIMNPERTCGGFCSRSGLECENGFDDGKNGCEYGGPGIGCDDILGVGSVGGPTPDHVCVCKMSTSSPTSDPTTSPTTSQPTSTASPTTANIALDKPTTQSSTQSGGVSSRAVDGNTDGRWKQNSVTSTRGGTGSTNPSWSVDLTGRYEIGQIMVYNRQDCCSDRLEGFKVIIWDGSVEEWTYTHVGGTPPYLNVINVPGKYGTKVEVTIPGDGKILHLAEVEVFGPTTSPTSYPTKVPTKSPKTSDPTKPPTSHPTEDPTRDPTQSPTNMPTLCPEGMAIMKITVKGDKNVGKDKAKWAAYFMNGSGKWKKIKAGSLKSAKKKKKVFYNECVSTSRCYKIELKEKPKVPNNKGMKGYIEVNFTEDIKRDNWKKGKKFTTTVNCGGKSIFDEVGN